MPRHPPCALSSLTTLIQPSIAARYVSRRTVPLQPAGPVSHFSEPDELLPPVRFQSSNDRPNFVDPLRLAPGSADFNSLRAKCHFRTCSERDIPTRGGPLNWMPLLPQPNCQRSSGPSGKPSLLDDRPGDQGSQTSRRCLANDSQVSDRHSPWPLAPRRETANIAVGRFPVKPRARGVLRYGNQSSRLRPDTVNLRAGRGMLPPDSRFGKDLSKSFFHPPPSVSPAH